MLYTDRAFIDRFEPVADLGADAVEFWTWQDKDLDAVERELDAHGLDLVGMVGTEGPLTDPGRIDETVAEIERSVEVAADLDCPTLFVLTGDERDDASRARQRELVAEGLEAAAPAAEAAGVTLVLEPLNTAIDHPGYFLEAAEEGFDIVRTVDSPAVELLYDVYHQQVTEGNIIQTVTENVEDIGHVHVADVPGRYEPGTGELNYPNVVEAVEDAGYDGYFGFEFRAKEESDEAIQAGLSLRE
ncbi:TIM barrel protein [Halomicroarcula sp. F27]|uniref:TIM barrel protein n=2 Tax=Haloarcula nitratireducens TaxID=2487749 RepID=A0AAW4P867_9EURY|nr:TIM barrel protein [Halomicroarcula nitratireducens]